MVVILVLIAVLATGACRPQTEPPEAVADATPALPRDIAEAMGLSLDCR